MGATASSVIGFQYGCPPSTVSQVDSHWFHPGWCQSLWSLGFVQGWAHTTLKTLKWEMFSGDSTREGFLPLTPIGSLRSPFLLGSVAWGCEDCKCCLRWGPELPGLLHGVRGRHPHCERHTGTGRRRPHVILSELLDQFSPQAG